MSDLASRQTVLLVLVCLLVLLISSTGQTCKVAERHPQWDFCYADFVIKAIPIRTDVTFKNTTDTPDGRTPNGRVYFLKIKKVYKSTDQYAALAAAQMINETNLLPVYTPRSDGACGADLDLDTTYLLHGKVRADNKLYVRYPAYYRWNENQVPRQMRRALSRQYHKSCGVCTVQIHSWGSMPSATPDQCIWDRVADTNSCYEKHSVCLKNKKKSGNCEWTSSASLRACLQKAEKQDNEQNNE